MSLYSLCLPAVVYFIGFNTGATFSSPFSQVEKDTSQRACTNNEFLCSTGSCIQLSLLCDGVKNCNDGSDESEELCGHRRLARQTQENCSLPEQPLNGHYSLGGCNPPSCRPVPGTVIPHAMLNYTCNSGYQLSGSRILFCGERWSSPFPTCEGVAQTCPPLKSDSQMIKCYFGSREVRCDRPMDSNTRANVSCKESYTAPLPQKKFSMVCQNGSWSRALTPCSPNCGRLNYVATNSSKNESHFLPWNAAILRAHGEKLQYICAASIISSRAVVTAAHCVWNSKIIRPEELLIKVGNYEEWIVESPIKWVVESQYTIEVKEIFIHSQFRGLITNFANDICLITLKKDIEFNEFIFPVCIDFDNVYNPLFTPGKNGIASSFSAAMRNDHHHSILTLKVVSTQDCERNVPRSFLPFLTYDKFCAGDINKTALCTGDSGAGLAQQFKDGLWYLTGLLSIGVTPRSDNFCETKYYSGFTRVSLFNDFIALRLGKKDSDDSEISLNPGEPTILCSDKQFQCQSSECVDASHLCDGEKHCADGSDETSNACNANSCPSWAFQCKYGACVNRSEICNGVNNCADGSDESFCKSNGTGSGENAAHGCKLPKQPENGNYQVRGCIDHTRIGVGSIVPQFVYLNYTCNPGYRLTGSSIIACVDGWTSTLPACDIVQCPPLKRLSREIRCASDYDEGNCQGVPLKVGTKVSVHCAPHYEQIPGLETYDMVCEANGKWSRQLESCVPKCGVPNPGGLPLVGFGIVSKLGVFPWHIGLYREMLGVMLPFCGGSLISARVVVSAAHCFWEADGNVVKDFHVVAGKYYYDWNNKTKYVQHLQVKDLIIHKHYKGSGRNYANDVALLILVHDVQINEAVRPVCVDYERTFLRYFSPHSTIGNVTGWGLDENQNQTRVLHTANLPYVDVEECERRTTVEFSSILTNDKFCAGNINKTTVCVGDSGGGYTVRFRNGRWYLVGIVSIGPHEKCALYPYATFTNVFDHLNFIRQYALVYL